MRKIKKIIDRIDDELYSAQDYAEKYVECKAKNNTASMNRYKEMAVDELKHAGYLHDSVVSEIEELSKTYTPPVEMETKWEYEHKCYVEKVAYIKQILTM